MPEEKTFYTPAEAVNRIAKFKDLYYRETRRMDATQKRLDILYDNWEDEIRAKIKPRVKPETLEKLSFVIEDNPFKNIIKELSTAYKVDPVRTIEPENEDDIIWYEVEQINEKMELAQIYMNACNDVAIYLQFRGDRVAVELLTGNVLIVIGKDEDPTIPEIVFIRRLKDENDTATPDNTYWICWTDESHYMIDSNGSIRNLDGNPDMVNPYGKIPMVYLHREIPVDRFFDETTGNDLVDLAINTGVRVTMDEFARFESGFKQPAISGDNLQVSDDILKNPDSMIKVEGIDVEIQLLDWQIDLEKREQDIRNKKERVGENYGVDSRIGEAKRERSGISFVVKNQKLVEHREKQIKQFVRAETEIYELKKLIESIHGIKRKEKFSIKFPEPKIYVAPEIELQIQVTEINAGLKSKVDIYMKRNQIADRQQAIDELKRIQEENDLFTDSVIMNELNKPEPAGDEGG